MTWSDINVFIKLTAALNQIITNIINTSEIDGDDCEPNVSPNQDHISHKSRCSLSPKSSANSFLSVFIKDNKDLELIYFIFCIFVSCDGVMSSEAFEPRLFVFFVNVGLSFHQRTETLNNYWMSLTFVVLRGWILLALVDLLGFFFPSSAPLRLTSSLCHQSVPTTAEWIAMKFDADILCLPPD